MKIYPRLVALLVLLTLTLATVPASAASPTLTPKITSCTTTRTSVTLRWVTANTPEGKKINGYGIVAYASQTPTRTLGRKARTGTVHGLAPRTAYRVQLYPFVPTGGQTIPSCLAYTKTASDKATTPMLHPLITSTSSTTSTVSATWSSGESKTSALPASYLVTVFPEDTGTGPMISVPEPLSSHAATVAGLLAGTSYYVNVATVNTWGQWAVGSLVETAEPISTTTTVPTTSTTTP